jgi:hypothetical protein
LQRFLQLVSLQSDQISLFDYTFPSHRQPSHDFPR